MTPNEPKPHAALTVKDFLGTWRVSRSDGTDTPARQTNVIVSQAEDGSITVTFAQASFPGKIQDGVLRYGPASDTWFGQISVIVQEGRRFLYAAIIRTDPQEIGIFGADDEPGQLGHR